MIGCDCAVCRSPNPRNHRYRCAVLVQTPQGNLLIDTPPELRLQLLRERIGVVHAVLFTHYHADHLFSLDDLRPIPHKLGGPVPLYCTAEVEGKIRTTFAYAFGPSAAETRAGYLPKLIFRRITDEPFTVLGERVTPVPLAHAHFDVFGFRIGDVAYCTDVSADPAGKLAAAGGAARAGAGRAAAAAAYRPFRSRPGPRRDRKAATGTGLPDPHQSRVGI